MFHLLWYLLIGLFAGVISKHVMHVHITLEWTIILGIIGSLLGGAVTHLVSRSRNVGRNSHSLPVQPLQYSLSRALTSISGEKASPPPVAPNSA